MRYFNARGLLQKHWWSNERLDTRRLATWLSAQGRCSCARKLGIRSNSKRGGMSRSSDGNFVVRVGDHLSGVAIQIYERRRLCGAGKESGGVMTGYPIATPPRLNYGGGQ